MNTFFGSWRVLFHTGRIVLSGWLFILIFGLSDAPRFGTVQYAINDVTGGSGTLALTIILLIGIIGCAWPVRSIYTYAFPLVSQAIYAACGFASFVWYALIDQPRDPLFIAYHVIITLLIVGIAAGAALVEKLEPVEDRP